MWELIFDWPALIDRGADAVAYLVMASIGTLLFMIRLGVAMIGGADSDFDAADAADSDAAFSIFSVLSILAFFMGAGWMGLACRLDWGLGRFTSTLAAGGFGIAMMLAASALTYTTRRLNREISYDVHTAVGRTCRVYLTIPAHGDGHGQVEATVSGRKKILRAISDGPRIEAFADVKVLEVRDDETLVVAPID